MYPGHVKKGQRVQITSTSAKGREGWIVEDCPGKGGCLIRLDGDSEAYGFAYDEFKLGTRFRDDGSIIEQGAVR